MGEHNAGFCKEDFPTRTAVYRGWKYRLQGKEKKKKKKGEEWLTSPFFCLMRGGNDWLFAIWAPSRRPTRLPAVPGVCQRGRFSTKISLLCNFDLSSVVLAAAKQRRACPDRHRAAVRCLSPPSLLPRCCPAENGLVLCSPPALYDKEN